ncbi:uncharacterized protein I303_106164 [Kwoniella dejecticola CBS 10117]|uniref:Uncharacterized protein n=1 Tax=Kwoniella dejecticola CBS 10117 TaxID=1296121 RepID=A0A1A6A1G4_9TREE|nr:uncharacterized protein I303_06182 [Kwoniella dejecticola CBS 10117]OBR83897.1 hypothetical protein I303_06182 [Kwoniella dejecticola CBS 10117]
MSLGLAARKDMANDNSSRIEIPQLQHRQWGKTDPGVVRIHGVDGIKAVVEGKTLDRSGSNQEITFSKTHKNEFIEIEDKLWDRSIECALGMGPGYSVAAEFDLRDLRHADKLPYNRDSTQGNDTLSIVCYEKDQGSSGVKLESGQQAAPE